MARERFSMNDDSMPLNVDQADVVVTPRSARPSIPTLVVWVIFGLLFSFYLYEAIAQTLQLSVYVSEQNKSLANLGHPGLSFPWLAIAPYLLFPVIVYAVALFLSRRRAFLTKVAIFVVALAMAAAVSLTLESLASAMTRIV